MGARKKKGLLLLLLLLQTPRFTETTGHSGLQQQNNRRNRMGIWIKPARARCKNRTKLCAQWTHKDLPLPLSLPPWKQPARGAGVCGDGGTGVYGFLPYFSS